MAKGRRIHQPKEAGPIYRQFWRIVDGAVASCFEAHPDYLARPERNVRMSINKRVAGAMTGYITQVMQGRSGEEPAVETTASWLRDASADACHDVRRAGHMCGRVPPALSAQEDGRDG